MKRRLLVPGRILGFVGALGLVLSGHALVGVLLMFVGIWGQGRSLQGVFSTVAETPLHPARLAHHLAAILHMALIAFAALGCVGIMQLVATLFQARPARPLGAGAGQGSLKFGTGFALSDLGRSFLFPEDIQWRSLADFVIGAGGL